MTVVDFMKGREGEFRFVLKGRNGFSISTASPSANATFNMDLEMTLALGKKGVVQTVEFKAEDSEYWFPIFKRKGKKIQIDRELLNVLTVGTINSLFLNTELYDQTQYKLNGAKTWADLAYGKNEVETVK
jgi:hypothetical protein